MDLSDEEQHALAVRFLEGDATVVEALCASVAQRLWGYIRGILARDDQEAEEILQETWVYFLHTGLHKYDPRCGRLLPFLKATARIVALRYYRERKRRGEVEQLLSQWRRRHPEIDTDPELADILAFAHDQASPSVEDMALEVEYTRLKAELFEITFTHGTSPPHQLVVLGLRLVPAPVPVETGTGGRVQKGSALMPPRRIVVECSDTDLTTLTGHLEDELVRAVTYLDGARIRDLLHGLRQGMGQNVEAIRMQCHLDLQPWCVAVAWHHDSDVALTVPLDEPKRAAIIGILQRCLVGTTRFRHYYTTQKPEDDIGHWCEAVQRQVWQAILRQGKGPLFVRLQDAEAHKQRDAGERAQARQAQRESSPPDSTGGAAHQ